MATKNYRTNGAIGALLDEYEKAINELKALIIPISNESLAKIVDNKTQDEDCRSIQTILTHVVRAGYYYAFAIKMEQEGDFKEKENILARTQEKSLLPTVSDYQTALDDMLQFNVEVFEDYPNMKLEEHDNDKKIAVRWGQSYDVEQLMEHAIVHILRHRRQIERFLLKLKTS